ncbi:hypothetical protein ACTZPI_28195, partial [Klebsiella pneumoniae]
KRAYCLKTQPATGETYPKSDLFNKAAGMGCTIVAEGMRHLAPSNVSFVVLEDLNIVQEWELVWRKDRCSEVLKSLINLI